MWVIQAGGTDVLGACKLLGIEQLNVEQSDEAMYWQTILDIPNVTTLASRIKNRQLQTTEWILIPRMQDRILTNKLACKYLLQDAIKNRNARAVILIWTLPDQDEANKEANK